MNKDETDFTYYDYCVPDAQWAADLYDVQGDLQEVREYCEIHVHFDPERIADPYQKKAYRAIRQSLFRSAVVMYGRAWNTGNRRGLGPIHLNQMSQAAQLLHAEILTYRNKWVAHAANHFDQLKIVIGVPKPPNLENLGNRIAFRSQKVVEVSAKWMMKFHSVVVELLEILRTEAELERQRLNAAVATMPLEEITSRKPAPYGIEKRTLNSSKGRRKFSDR